jgi:hypothetical protein
LGFGWNDTEVVSFLVWPEANSLSLPDYVTSELGSQVAVEKINQILAGAALPVAIEPPVVVGDTAMTRGEVIVVAVSRIGEATSAVSALGPTTDDERKQILTLALDTVSALGNLLPAGTAEGEAFKAVLGQRSTAVKVEDVPEAPRVAGDGDASQEAA